MKTVALRILLIVVLGLGSLTFASAEDNVVKITGWVTEDHCGAKGASTGHESCATRCVSEKGAKWALYVPEDKTLYIIVDQEEAAKHNSQEVKVMATMDKDKRTAKITAWTWQ